MVNVLLAGAIAMIVALVVTPMFTKFLVKKSYGQFIHDDLTQHHHKRGKPTMGGAVIIGAVVVGYLLSRPVLMGLDTIGLFDVSPTPLSLSALLVLFLLIALGLVGFLDDFTKISKERSLGLTSIQKIIAQTLITVVFALLALLLTDDQGRSPASTAISFVRDTSLDLAFAGPVIGVLLFVLWANLLITGASNGVNITDGLDGLATGVCVLVFGAYTVISLWQFSQNCDIAPSASCYEVRDSLDLAILSCAIAGACFGFLWWNASPAQIIMGDTGSLSLGAALAGLAILTRTQLLLPILGALFVIITMSVIIQVACFKLTGKRVFRMAPLHHHFELAGWAEVKIVARFTIIAGSGVAIGLALFYAEWVTGI